MCPLEGGTPKRLKGRFGVPPSEETPMPFAHLYDKVLFPEHVAHTAELSYEPNFLAGAGDVIARLDQPRAAFPRHVQPLQLQQALDKLNAFARGVSSGGMYFAESPDDEAVFPSHHVYVLFASEKALARIPGRVSEMIRAAQALNCRVLEPELFNEV